jgi:23S rRNA-/tRNA-specific pseudouridylate synthase
MYIPSVVFEMIEDNEVEVKVLEANSPWFGVTYKDDKPIVVNKIKALIKEGVYPEQLW